MIRATNVVADDVAANAEVGAHVLAIGRHDTGYAILPSEDHDATIGQVGPDDLSLRKVPRQSDRITALVSPRPTIRHHSPPPGFGPCVMPAFHRATLIVSPSYYAFLLPDHTPRDNNEYTDRSPIPAPVLNQ